MTFKDLESLDCYLREKSESSSLNDWYRSVRDIPLAELELKDVCIALRQSIYVVAVLPVAIKFLEEDPLCGEKYDGELISAMSGLEESAWIDVFAANKVLSILHGLLAVKVDGLLRADIHRLSCLLTSMSPRCT